MSISGEKSIEALGGELFDALLRVCSGRTVKAEENGACEISINQNFSYV